MCTWKHKDYLNQLRSSFLNPCGNRTSAFSLWWLWYIIHCHLKSRTILVYLYLKCTNETKQFTLSSVMCSCLGVCQQTWCIAMSSTVSVVGIVLGVSPQWTCLVSPVHSSCCFIASLHSPAFWWVELQWLSGCIQSMDGELTRIRLQGIVPLILPIMLCCNTQNFHRLCSYKILSFHQGKSVYIVFVQCSSSSYSRSVLIVL